MSTGVNRACNPPVQTGKRRAVHALSTHVDSAPLEFEFQAVYYITAGTWQKLELKMAGTGPAAAYTSSLRSFKCSRCDASFTDMTRCKQHCNQPGSFCNRGRAREDFAKVISVEVLFRASDRDVGGTRARLGQDAGDLDHDGHPYNDSDGGRASEEADLPSIPGISSWHI